MTAMNPWWQWQGERDAVANSFCVIGVGRFGSAVCRELVRAGREVLAIDLNQRAIDTLRQQEPGIECRIVDCTDEEALRDAGALDVGTVVVAISEPIEASITATLIVRDSAGSQVQQVISRATSDLHEKMLLRVGAHRVVFPSKMQGSRLGLELVRPNLLDRLRLDANHSIEEIKVPPALVGRSLRDLNLRRNHAINVLAAGPPHQLQVNPPASHVLAADELLVVIGRSEDLERLGRL
jgi:trk system potassium uptake protein TrkA